MKCGTTALHAYLDAHPDILMAAPKEMNFFVGPRVEGGDQSWHGGNWHRGLDWYASHFAEGRVCGEASPSYTSPSFPEAAERMAAVLPDARLIYLVRDPIDRALSQYAHHRAAGTERRPLTEALLDEESQYIARSRYHERVRPYLERFPSDRIAIVLQEHLLVRRRSTMSSLFDFLGVDETFWSPTLESRFHIGVPTDRTLHRPLARELTARLADDVVKLRTLTGRDLAEWRAYA